MRAHAIHTYLIMLAISLLALTSCQQYHVSDDPNLRLQMSCDTLQFDTIFTVSGSATQRIMLLNPHKRAIRIERVWMEHGTNFQINLDGENDMERMKDIEIDGGDSLFLFVRVHIDPQDSNSPVLVEDAIHLRVNENTQDIHLTAYGQDVRLIQSEKHVTHVQGDYTFDAARPYLIYDTLVIHGKTTMQAGATIYFHQRGALYAGGDVEAIGTIDAPIRLRGDRLDNLFDSVPYAYAAGQWSGLYLIQPDKGEAAHYEFRHVDITSGNVGLYCESERKSDLPHLTLSCSRIHNHSLYGLVLQNIDADIDNTEISNCASYCVYLSGGKHRFVHTTIASYFRWTNVNIQSTGREDVAAVYINNLSKQTVETTASFLNSIITGVRSNNLMLATPLPQYYGGEFIGCYLKTDTLFTPHAHDNVYYQAEDTAKVFVNDMYRLHEWQYYDFQLDSLSPARGIGDSTLVATYPTDKRGKHRPTTGRPDAGCYQF